MTEMTGSLGCVYSHCVDDDSYDLTPEGTYYAWSVRVPRSEHLRRNEHGVPIAVAALWDYLQTRLPTGVDDWHVRPDQDLSLRDAAADVLGRHTQIYCGPWKSRCWDYAETEHRTWTYGRNAGQGSG